jgi:GMP synthase (glutamine-hydrolysing)
MTTLSTPTSPSDAATAARVLVVVHEDDSGLGRLDPYLRERLGPASIDDRHPGSGDELPTDLSGHDAVVVLGGVMAAWEDDVAPWLPGTRALLAEAVDRGVPALGICLGFQLLAMATGGRAERGTHGLEIGYVEVDLLPAAADDALLGAVHAEAGPRIGVAHWHQDTVTELPPGAVPLATGQRYARQAFRLGERAWGVQYHPEVTAADYESWLVGGHGTVVGAGLHPDDLRPALAAGEESLARVARTHAVAFADVVAAYVARR